MKKLIVILISSLIITSCVKVDLGDYKEKKDEQELNCKSLRIKLNQTRKGTDEYKRLESQFKKRCI